MPVLGLLFRDRKTTVKLGDTMKLIVFDLEWNPVYFKRICFIGL